MDDVNDLSAQQKEVERQTREAREELAEKRREATEKLLDESTGELVEKLDRQKEALDELSGEKLSRRDRNALDSARKSLERLREMVEQRDIQQAQQEARETLERLENLRFGLQLSQRYTSKNSKEGKRLRRSLETTKETIPRGEKIARKLDEIMEKGRKKLDSGDNERLEELAKKQRSISKRGQKLRKKIQKSAEKFPALEQQLVPRLDEAGESMQRAEQSLEQQKAQQALDHERKALERLGKLKESMKNTLRRERSKGKRGGTQSRDDVAIPERGAESSPERFREGMEDAMKEDRLEAYDSEIEKYYKSLVE
jgi:hypothetical protein